MKAPTTKPTEMAERVQAHLLELVVQIMEAHGHLDNLLRLAQPKAEDEVFTLVSAAVHYADAAFKVVQKMDELVHADPEALAEVSNG